MNFIMMGILVNISNDGDRMVREVRIWMRRWNRSYMWKRYN
jgi:hypothetical protein